MTIDLYPAERYVSEMMSDRTKDTRTRATHAAAGAKAFVLTEAGLPIDTVLPVDPEDLDVLVQRNLTHFHEARDAIRRVADVAIEEILEEKE